MSILKITILSKTLPKESEAFYPTEADLDIDTNDFSTIELEKAIESLNKNKALGFD